MSANENKYIFLAVGSDHTGRGNVEISQVGGQSKCSRRFICVKPCANVQGMLYSMLYVHSSMSAERSLCD